MSTINPFAPGSFQSREKARTLAGLNKAAQVLEQQMVTGRRSDRYSGFGVERGTALDLRGRLAQLDSYATRITGTNIRLQAMVQGMETLDRIASQTRSSAMSPLSGISADGVPQEQALARNNFAFAVEIMNTETNGRWLFGGRSDDRPPVQPSGTLMTQLQTNLAGVTDPATIMAQVEAFFATPANWLDPNADTAGSARDSVGARVDDGLTLSVGARPDEPGMRSVMVGLAALAAADTGTMTREQYTELAGLVANRLSTSNPLPRDIATDLGRAQSTVAAVKDRHETSKALLQESLDGIELVSTEESAVKLLALQTRLQASYQTTATLSRLSLVNYL